MSKDELIQEIKDLFAKYGSGDYVPSEEEKTIIDMGLETVIEQYRKTIVDDTYGTMFDYEG